MKRRSVRTVRSGKSVQEDQPCDNQKPGSSRSVSEEIGEVKVKEEVISRKPATGKETIDEVPFTLLRRSETTADWDAYFKNYSDVDYVCPVDFFWNAPFASKWSEFARVGTKVEVLHPQCAGDRPVYVIATIKRFAGYKALLKFEKEGLGPDMFAWMSFCSDIPKTLGYASLNNHLVLPVMTSDLRKPDTDNLLMGKVKVDQFEDRVFTDSRNFTKTISRKHGEVVKKELEKKLGNVRLGQVKEVMDKEEPVRNRLAIIHKIIGDRVHVKYLDAGEDDQGFCFNAKSELLHPLGWSHTVGQILKGYPVSSEMLPSLSKQSFPKYPSDLKIHGGMVFELRHPFYPYMMVSGSIKKKLKYGYFIASIETNDPEHQAEFVFHVTSDYILPCGFCKEYNIPLEVPKDENEETFEWKEYCYAKKVAVLDLEKIPKKPSHKFKKGCKFEAVDVCQPLYLGPATVKNVAAHLLYIHFDGWPEQGDSYQWVSAFTPDIYPAGWAEMVGHCFQSHAERPKPEDSFFILQNNEISSNK